MMHQPKTASAANDSPLPFRPKRDLNDPEVLAKLKELLGEDADPPPAPTGANRKTPSVLQPHRPNVSDRGTVRTKGKQIFVANKPVAVDSDKIVTKSAEAAVAAGTASSKDDDASKAEAASALCRLAKCSGGFQIPYIVDVLQGKSKGFDVTGLSDGTSGVRMRVVYDPADQQLQLYSGAVLTINQPTSEPTPPPSSVLEHAIMRPGNMHPARKQAVMEIIAQRVKDYGIHGALGLPKTASTASSSPEGGATKGDADERLGTTPYGTADTFFHSGRQHRGGMSLEPMAMPKANRYGPRHRVFTIVQHNFSSDALPNLDANTGFIMLFKIADVAASINTFLEVFNQYRIVKVRPSFYPCINTCDNDVYSRISPAKNQDVGRLGSWISYDTDAVLPASMKEGTADESFRLHCPFVPFSRTFAPKLFLGAWDGMAYTAHTEAPRGQWVTSVDEAAEYFGLRLYLEFDPTLVDATPIKWACWKQYLIQLRYLALH